MPIPVLLYHHINNCPGDVVTVTPEVFTAQMAYLHTEGYTTLTAQNLMEFIDGKFKLSSKAVLITFDDGWLDNYIHAVPILRRFNFKSTHFLVTGRVDAALTPASVKQATDHKNCKSLVQSGRAGEVVMGWNIVCELAMDPLFEFFSHTVSHRHCADLTTKELLFELAQSKAAIESQLGRPCDFLCWPYGSFSQSALESAAKLGYKGTFSTINGFCCTGSDPFLVSRIEVQDSVEWLQNRLNMES